MAGLSAPSAAVPARTQLRLLLGLHFRILRRQATATPGRKLVTFLLVSLGSVASLLLAGTAASYFFWGRQRLGIPQGSIDEAIHLVFAVVYGIIVLAPALGFRGNEFLDVTRLFHLPVSHRTVFTASTLGTCVSGAVLFWVPPLVGVVVGAMAPGTWNMRLDRMEWDVFAIRLALVAAFLFHAVAVGQILVLLLLNLLRSRRFQDLGMTIAPVVGGVVYLGTFLVLSQRRGLAREGAGVVREILASEPSRWFPFLPSRWLTEALVGAGRDGWSHTLPFLLGFLPLTWMALAFAAHLQERAFLGDIPPLRAGGGGSGRRIPGAALLRRWFPDPVLAIASKEFRLLRREPIVRTVLISQAFFLALPVIVLAVRTGRGEDAGETVARIAWVLPFLLVFVENTLTMNLLGLEGPGVSHLRTTPISWRDTLLGKDLCYLLGFGALNALGTTTAILLLAILVPDRMPDPWTACALAIVGGTAALAVVVAVGNVLSVAMPTALTARGRMALRQQAAFSEGCYEKLLRVAVFAGTILLVAPVPMALHVLPSSSQWTQEWWWTPLGAVFCVFYARALLLRSLPLAERLAREGEETILGRLTRSGE